MATIPDMACREFVELVTYYLEGVLPADLRGAFDAHLQVCSGCELYLGQMRLTVRALRALQPAALSPGAQAALIAGFRSWQAGA